MNSLAGYDNQNGWERYRATLPFSRKDIPSICARYLLHRSVFSVVMACAAWTLLNILSSLPLFDPMGILRQPDLRGSLKSQPPRRHRCFSSPSWRCFWWAQPLFFRFGHMEARTPIPWPVCPVFNDRLRTRSLIMVTLTHPPTPSATGLCRFAGANPDPRRPWLSAIATGQRRGASPLSYQYWRLTFNEKLSRRSVIGLALIVLGPPRSQFGSSADTERNPVHPQIRDTAPAPDLRCLY